MLEKPDAPAGNPDVLGVERSIERCTGVAVTER